MRKKSGIEVLLFYTDRKNRIMLIRLVVGLIFFSEGLLKIIHPEIYGTARFEKIGFSDPAFWAYFTATFEVVCGILILIGFLTRLASIPLLIVMVTAFVTTKWPILVAKGFGAMVHEYRTDFAMTLSLIFLLIYGAGNWSVDARLYKSKKV